MTASEAGPLDRPALEAWLDRFGVVASFVWGVAEATLFFFVPDVMVGAVALFRPRKALWAALAAIGGALVGGTLMYLVGRTMGPDLLRLVEGVPGIPPEMVSRVHADLLQHGGLAMSFAPLQGIPYKLYVTQWSVFEWGLPAMLGWTIPARAIRIVPYALLVAGLGVFLRNQVRARPRLWLTLYLAIWTGIYVGYFWINGF